MMITQMSLVTDSPVHSSSGDDFAAFLDSALGSSSPDASSGEEDENQDEIESQEEIESVRCCLQAVSTDVNGRNMS